MTTVRLWFAWRRLELRAWALRSRFWNDLTCRRCWTGHGTHKRPVVTKL